ncbi:MULTISPECIES: hypothetical protein [Mesorhizobium]|uniref:hypothetical protein n=1 Tax=Mesorhizobium TaxID=68287 RepID=UPI0010A97296|nr:MULTISPECIES: hypothetical protein [Mesorhizobium]
MGFGQSTCAEITRLKPVDRTPEAAAVMSWAQGYMSALNIDHVRNGKPFQDLGAVTISGQLAFMLNYCDKNPLKQFGVAVHSLYISLPQVTETK